MRFIYLTSQRYPSNKVEPVFIRLMAEAFQRVLGEDFIFCVRGRKAESLSHLNVATLPLPWRGRRLAYFVFLPFVILLHGFSDEKNTFFSSDPYLLATLIFWKRLIGFRYKIVSDWHQLFNDWRDKYVAEGSDKLIVTTERLKHLIVVQCHVSEGRIKVAYGSVDVTHFGGELPKRRDLGLPEHSILVGYVGGFRSVGLEKGLDTMIKALPLLPREVSMFFVGGSPAHIAEYQALADSLGVKDRTFFFTKQSLDKVAAYERVADMLVIPYPDRPHFREYGFPLKVWEYMAAGRPIVYSNLAVIAEVLSGRGTPFAPEDPQSLRGAIVSVLDNKAVAEERAKENAQESGSFTWDARAQKIIDFLK